MHANGSLINEWQSAVQVDVNGNGLWINRLMLGDNPDGSDGDNYRQWAAMHDGEFLYVLILSDDIGARTSDSTDLWKDDSTEIFIDGNNSKLAQWGDDDDFHAILPLLKRNTSESNDSDSGRYLLGPNNTNDDIEYSFTTGPGIGPKGIRRRNWERDVYEIAIDLDSAGIEIGELFGFEVQVNDDDDGGNRDSKWGWYHPSRSNGVDTDQTYVDPSIMGTLILAD